MKIWELLDKGMEILPYDTNNPDSYFEDSLRHRVLTEQYDTIEVVAGCIKGTIFAALRPEYASTKNILDTVEALPHIEFAEFLYMSCKHHLTREKVRNWYYDLEELGINHYQVEMEEYEHF